MFSVLLIIISQVRILWMVPLYAVQSYLSLQFHKIRIYIDTIRDLYEAYGKHHDNETDKVGLIMAVLAYTFYGCLYSHCEFCILLD